MLTFVRVRSLCTALTFAGGFWPLCPRRSQVGGVLRGLSKIRRRRGARRQRFSHDTIVGTNSMPSRTPGTLRSPEAPSAAMTSRWSWTVSSPRTDRRSGRRRQRAADQRHARDRRTVRTVTVSVNAVRVDTRLDAAREVVRPDHDVVVVETTQLHDLLSIQPASSPRRRSVQ